MPACLGHIDFSMLHMLGTVHIERCMLELGGGKDNAGCYAPLARHFRHLAGTLAVGRGQLFRPF